MEAIRKVTDVEEKTRAERAAAEARVKKALADAGREGETLLRKARGDADAMAKELLRNAEERAAAAAVDIAAEAERESDALRAAAKGRLDEAADYIVGRVVKG